MTARIVTASYGMKELVSLYHRYSYSGLAVAIILHFLVIGLYYAFLPLFLHEIPVVLTRGPLIQIDYTPSITANGMMAVGTPVIRTKSSFGLPVPVPGIDLTAEESFKEPTGFSNTGSPGIGEEGGLDGYGGPGETGGFSDDAVIDLTSTFDEHIVLPQAAREVKPEYPEDARRLGMEGLVVVKLLVNKEGKPQKAEIFSSQNEIFDNNAKKAALQWLFTPAIANGYLVSVWVTVPFNFRLNR
jgi:TonB family protein